MPRYGYKGANKADEDWVMEEKPGEDFKGLILLFACSIYVRLVFIDRLVSISSHRCRRSFRRTTGTKAPAS
jgi:hypothetical protein